VAAVTVALSHGGEETGERRQPTVVVAAPGMLIAEAVARAMREGGLHVVGSYVRLPALLDKIHRSRPSVVVVDADLRASADGAPDILAQLVEAGPSCRFAVVAGKVDPVLAREVTQLGIHAVILKSSAIADAVRVIQHVARGRTSFPSAVLEQLSEAPQARGLSSRQLEVLEELALGRSNEEIARGLFISTNTVKFHLRTIYERLGVRNRVEAAQLLAAQRVAQSPTRTGGALATPGGLQPSLRAIPTPERHT
jgi:DNA-binding NarL/FixJ family response regulator